ncbi:MAG: hypothetical protein AAF515_01605 [Pseudomonadota bacterium]
MNTTAHRHEVPDDPLGAIDYCFDQGWTDGLPVVPPEAGRVAAMLAFEGRPPETVIAEHPATGLRLTVESLAANAVMAGCKPEYLPVLVAAFEAMNEPDFNFHGSCASTGGSAPLLIVSGPAVEELGLNSGVNLFGPGNRANATIGRAVRLALLNVFKMIPGISDKSTQGHPGKFSFCIGERADRSPWPRLCEALDYPEGVSSVTVYAGAGFVNLENHGANTPEMLCDSFADGMANYGCISKGETVLVVSPEHAKIIGDAGWSREQTQAYLFERARRTVGQLQAIGKYHQREHERGQKLGADDAEHIHRGLTPDDILIVVGGGDAGGHSAFIPSWSRTRGSLRQSKPIGVCLDC